jgi:hypothetical protein
MRNAVRILIAIACVMALYYLVTALARSFVERDVPSPPPAALQEHAGQEAGFPGGAGAATFVEILNSR